MYFTLAFRTLILYVFIIILYRMMGKKEVSELGVGDLIVTVLIAELAALCIEQTDSSILISIIPILVLVCSEMLISYINLKSEKFRKLVDGTPSVIIKNGKIEFSVMSKLRYTLDDLITQLRIKGIKNIDEVDYAVLENNGELSVFQNTKDYPLPIILDGKIDYKTLREVGKNKLWIDKLLAKKNLKLEQVFYAFYTKKKTYIIKKSELL